MSEANVELARSGFDAWNRGDYDAWIEMFDSECEFWPLRAQLEGRPYRGHDGLRQFIRDTTDEWEDVRFVLSEIRDTGDQLVGLVRFEGRGRISRAEIDVPIGIVGTVREGKVVEARMYSDPDEALEGAGLSESAMSEENVELVREATDALNRGDVDAWLAFLSPDVVWEALPGVPGLGELYRGRAEVRAWIEQLFELAEGGVHTEIEQITDLSDGRVFLAVVLTARGRGSGVPFEMPAWSVIWFAEGLVTRRQVFWTRDEALEAAGLSE